MRASYLFSSLKRILDMLANPDQVSLRFAVGFKSLLDTSKILVAFGDGVDLDATKIWSASDKKFRRSKLRTKSLTLS